MKYNHAISLSIEVESENEIPTSEEIKKAFMKELEKSEVDLSFEVFDTFETE